MNPTPKALRQAAENYAKNILAHGKDDRIEGLVVMVVMCTPKIPPQYAINAAREEVPKILEAIHDQVMTENLVILPAKGKA